MKNLIIIICIFFGLNSFAQSTDSQNINVQYTSEASYEGGAARLTDNLHYLMNFTEEDIEARTNGVITTSFDVYPDGSIRDIVIFNGINENIDNEFKKALSEIKFDPAAIDGQPIKSNVVMDFHINASFVK